MLLRSLPDLSPLTRDVADRSENCWRLLVRRLHAKFLGIEAEDADVVQGGRRCQSVLGHRPVRLR